MKLDATYGVDVPVKKYNQEEVDYLIRTALEKQREEIKQAYNAGVADGAEGASKLIKKVNNL